MKFLKFFSLCLFLFGGKQVIAHPYYALKVGQNRCTACHVSAVGGGVRNLDGKFFGYRGLKPSKFGKQDLISADVRALFYYPEKSTQSKGGAGVMAGNFAANIPLNAEGEPEDTKFVYEYNLGGFPSGTGGPRDGYVRFQYYQEGQYKWYPQYLMLGRVRSPFGLQTDEHRTYTKIQTKNTWTDFDMGAVLSGDIGSGVHYDIGMANGAKTAGTGLGAGVATLWGGTFNLRLNPFHAPFYIGASTSYYDAKDGLNSPRASAAYAVFSFARLTGERLPLTVLAEYARAKNWNSTITGFFADTAYQDSVAGSESEALWGQAIYDVTPFVALNYKYDLFTPDVDYPTDVYERHGVGLRYRRTAHLSLMAQKEWAHATHPTESDSTAVGAQDATWFVFILNL